MNAYEMADELLRDNTQLTVKAAYMLRQQADRIRNLEKTLGFKNSGYETINLTPQIKELSDEEIQEISHDFGEIAWLGETTYKFARAILKKASEK
jgi:hypothetical protein